MHDLDADVSMDALIARPAETLEASGVRRLQEGLLAGAMALDEVQAYEEALAMDDPAEANAWLLARDEEPAFEMIRVAVLATLYSRMKQREETARQAVTEVRDLNREVAEEVAAYIELDRMRESAFRRDPGRFLPGARNCRSVSLLYPGGAWVIERDGDPYPWLVTHAALRYAQSDFDEVYDIAERNGRFHVVVIGAPGLKERLVMPPLAAMAEISIEILEIADITGPSGPTGRRVA
jgi:hypothetical protein